MENETSKSIEVSPQDAELVKKFLEIKRSNPSKISILLNLTSICDDEHKGKTKIHFCNDLNASRTWAEEIIKSNSDWLFVGSSRDDTELYNSLSSLRSIDKLPDILICDFHFSDTMRGRKLGIEIARNVTYEYPSVKIIMNSVHTILPEDCVGTNIVGVITGEVTKAGIEDLLQRIETGNSNFEIEKNKYNNRDQIDRTNTFQRNRRTAELLARGFHTNFLVKDEDLNFTRFEYNKKNNTTEAQIQFQSKMGYKGLLEDANDQEFRSPSYYSEDHWLPSIWFLLMFLRNGDKEITQYIEHKCGIEIRKLED